MPLPDALFEIYQAAKSHPSTQNKESVQSETFFKGIT